MTIIWDFISNVYANIVMMIMGDAPLSLPTVLTVVVVGGLAVLVGMFILSRVLRQEPLPPIIIHNTAPETNSLIPVVIMVFVLFVVVGGGLFIYVAR